MNNLGGVLRLFAALAILAIVTGGLPVVVLAAGGPTVTPPRMAFAQSSQVTTTGVPFTVSWSQGTPDGSPLARYELQKSIDAGPWTTINLSTPLKRTATVRSRPWTRIQLRLRAVDTANVAGEWAETDPQWLSVIQESDAGVALTSAWQIVSDAKAMGGRRAVTSTAGESATLSFIGRQVAWVAPVGSSRGTSTVSSSLGSTNVSQARAKASSQRIVFRATWPDNANHDLSITSLSAGKPVDVDAFLVLGDPTEGQLVGAGDISTCTNTNDSDTAALVMSVLDANPTAVAFTVGDNVYPRGSTEAFADCYDPTWGVFKARTRPTAGNHEYRDIPGAAPYYAYFGANAGSPGKGWYTYESGTWRVYGLNSECTAVSVCFKDQLAWLKADLAANPHRCVLGVWHRPKFSTGKHGPSPRMTQVFDALYNAGADVVLNGHDHGYQRFAPANPSGAADPARGIREFVVGTGGAELYAWKTTSTLLEVRDNTSFGVLRVDLHPGSYSWEFMPTTGPTGFTDSGTTACH